MWCERFVIIVVSLHRAFLPSGWGMFYPTVADVGILIGSFGLFFTLFLLFILCFLPHDRHVGGSRAWSGTARARWP